MNFDLGCYQGTLHWWSPCWWMKIPHSLDTVFGSLTNADVPQRQSYFWLVNKIMYGKGTANCHRTAYSSQKTRQGGTART
ncbi:hypothetical protein J6590_075726 [Homalodisca vitripennis]|nr:hypothetical protein J6590_075726 [Homalodisca vitripennis]